MKRREFIAATAALLVSPPRLWAQGKTRRIGFLTPFLDQPGRDAWHNGLREKGWIEGKNLLVEYRHYAETPDRLPALAAELVALTPDLVVAGGTQASVALKSATATIPIVFVAVGNPVAIGLIQSLSHPGGNVTGLTSVVPGDFIAKQVEIIRELIPGASKIALLVNPGNAMHRLALDDEMPRAAQRFSVGLVTVEATTAEGLDIAFAAAVASTPMQSLSLATIEVSERTECEARGDRRFDLGKAQGAAAVVDSLPDGPKSYGDRWSDEHPEETNPCVSVAPPSSHVTSGASSPTTKYRPEFPRERESQPSRRNLPHKRSSAFSTTLRTWKRSHTS